MRGPKGTLHEGGIRVPMFAHWKGRIPAGQIIEEMVTTLDLPQPLSPSPAVKSPQSLMVSLMPG